jgi:hypothetical protein
MTMICFRMVSVVLLHERHKGGGTVAHRHTAHQRKPAATHRGGVWASHKLERTPEMFINRDPTGQCDRVAGQVTSWEICPFNSDT